MRLCFFNRSFHPDVTATGQLLTELTSDLSKRFGHRVSVVAGPAQNGVHGESRPSARGWDLLRKELIDGVEVYRTKTTKLGKRHILGRFSDYMSYFSVACYAALRVPKPDIVVSFTDPPIIGLAALLAARRARARFVLVCQDVFPEVGQLLEGLRSTALSWMLQRVTRALLNRADCIVAIGETMRRRLVEEKGAHPSRTRVIHNWADCTAIQPGGKDNPFCLVEGLRRDFVVMHSGNIGLAQNLEVLVEAAEALQNHDDIQVVFVGDGVKRQELERTVRRRGLSNVRFFPFQPREVMGDSFATADVFVISLKPGLGGYIVPSKLYAILAAGKPYVAGVDEDSEVALLTRRRRCGLIATPGDPRELSEKILSLYRDRALAHQLGQNARQLAPSFDRNRQIAVYDRLFRELQEEARLPRPIPRLKRLFDVVVSASGLALSAPFWILIACAIKLEDGGPVFFRQQRTGLDGNPFTSWKFRSMAHSPDGESVSIQAREKDPRVTRVGRVLRATAMDELPQLWNILKGEMSFVGPRPLAPREIEANSERSPVALESIPGAKKRHSVPPGLTGLAQVLAPRDVPRRKKFRYDLLYVKKRSLGLDLRLMAVSFWITCRGKWESRTSKL